MKPKAAFYIFPKIDTKKFNITNDEQFALDLLREKKILIVHGSGFNWKDPDHFRVVYLPRVEVLEDASVKFVISWSIIDSKILLHYKFLKNVQSKRELTRLYVSSLFYYLLLYYLVIFVNILLVIILHYKFI